MCLKVLCFAAVLASFMTIVAGGALTAGLAEWCQSVMQSANEHHFNYIDSCWDTQTLSVNWTIANTDTQVSAGEYFYEYSVAQVTCWLNVVLWLVQLSLCVYRIVKQAQLQNSYQDPFVMDTADAFT